MQQLDEKDHVSTGVDVAVPNRLTRWASPNEMGFGDDTFLPWSEGRQRGRMVTARADLGCIELPDLHYGESPRVFSTGHGVWLSSTPLRVPWIEEWQRILLMCS